MIAAPAGTTHFKLISGGAEIDFDQGLFVTAYNDSTVLSYGPQETASLVLNNAVTAASTLPLFVVLGIEFFQEVNGEMYTLKNSTHNALCLVAVDVVAEPHRS
jgi:hypothetical protein